MAEWSIALDWKSGGRRKAARRFKSYRNRQFIMFNWLKRFFVKEITEPETGSVSFILPDGKQFNIETLDLSHRIENLHCKLHPDFNGLKPPKQNCNGCWEYHYQRMRFSRF